MDSTREAFDAWCKRKGFDSLQSFAIWDYVQASRSAAIEECAAWVDCKGYKTTANELRRLKGEG